MTQMEKTIIKKFIDDMILLFCRRYVDDTLVAIKRKHLKLVHDALNNFDKNLNFTVDTFYNVVSHFLDVVICSDDWSVYCKDTNTVQYTYYNSYSSWRYKTSWISSLVLREVNTCDKNKLQAKLTRIKDLIAWNGFPERIGDATINDRLKGINANNIRSTTNNEFKTI